MSTPPEVIDSLMRVMAQKDSALLALAAQPPETIKVAVHDTVVTVAAASLGWWAEFWRIMAQLVAAGLAVLGGAIVQAHFKNRDEAREDAEMARRDDEITIHVAMAVSGVCTYLRPVRDQIVSQRAVPEEAIEEVVRRVRVFEAQVPRVLQLRDRAHATKILLWHSLAEWIPHDLSILAGSMSRYGADPEPESSDPAIAHLKKSLLAFKAEQGGAQEKPPLTRRDVALQRTAQVLAQGRALGPTIDIYDPGGDRQLVTILSGPPRPSD